MVPIRCFTCGKLIGDKFADFESRAKNAENPAKILDDLGIKRYCCRRMMISAVDLIDQVLPYYAQKSQSP
jgi:DNA-directed RNA polymerase subunit N